MSQKLHRYEAWAWSGFFSVPVDGVLDEKEGEKKRGGGSSDPYAVRSPGESRAAWGHCYLIRIHTHRTKQVKARFNQGNKHVFIPLFQQTNVLSHGQQTNV